MLRRATRWILTITFIASLALLLMAGRETSAAETQASTAATVMRLQPPKPFSRMTLRELEKFQERAYAHYRGAWRFWVNHKTWYRQQEALSGSERCRGAVAPHWACWALEASIWTKRELSETQEKIEAHAKVAELRRLRAIGMYDFQTAARFADRIFPGTYSWLMSCSGGEGGHGGFVMNHLGSGAGGNMQFMYSTYDAYDNAAIKEANRRGARLPAALRDSGFGWQSPLGQAITAAFMRGVLGISHNHWSPAVDSACR